MEDWNIGFQKDISYFNFSANPAGGAALNPKLHYPLRAVGQYSSFPLFQLGRSP